MSMAITYHVSGGFALEYLLLKGELTTPSIYGQIFRCWLVYSVV